MLFRSILRTIEQRSTALEVLLDNERDRDAAVMSALSLASGYCLIQCGSTRAEYEAGAELCRRQMIDHYDSFRKMVERNKKAGK